MVVIRHCTNSSFYLLSKEEETNGSWTSLVKKRTIHVAKADIDTYALTVDLASRGTTVQGHQKKKKK